MPGLQEQALWDAEIYQIEQTDPVVGGPPNLAQGQGITNVPHQALANRTAWLKAQLQQLQNASLTQADLDAAIAALIGGAPAALDTLNELAAAFGDNPNFAATVTQSLTDKLSEADVNSGAIDGRFYRKDEWSGGFGATGWQRFPSGLIMQWGASATASNYTYITFPLAFPNGCRSVIATHDFVTYATNVHLVMMAGAITNTQAVFRGNMNGDANSTGQLSSAPFWWLAIGD